MTAPEILLYSLAICASAASAGLFLRLDRRTAALSALAALAAGGAACLVMPSELSLAAGLAIGLPLACLVAALRGRLSAAGAALYYLAGAGCFALYHVFRTGLTAVSGDGLVEAIYSVFFLLHVPAALLSFPALSVPPENLARLRRGGAGPSLSMAYLLAAGAALLSLLAAAFPFIPVDGPAAFLAVSAAATGLFWAGLGIIALLAAYDRRREQSSEEVVYHDDMAAFMNVVRSQRHDYNLHVQTVAGLIAREKWDECRAYVNSLVQDTARLNSILPLREPAAAALIGYYSGLAAKEGYTLVVDVRDDMSRIRTDAYETNKIIGNLLQNAFDELAAQPGDGEKLIELGIFKRGEFCIIRVSNRVTDPSAFSGGAERVFRQGYTTKPGHDGVGLSSIRVLARRAGGDVTAWLEGDMVHFVASIPMDSSRGGTGDQEAAYGPAFNRHTSA